MTVQDYKPFIERMINRYEGGYGWDRNDRGGPTKFGITCYDLAEHRHQHMDSMARWAPIVKAMPLSEADDIIDVKYAKPCCFAELGPGKDCVVLDFGYNSGSSRAIRYAQIIAGVKSDGVLGPISLKAINAYPAAEFINVLCDRRYGFMRGLSIWPTFGRGWTARIADLRAYSLGLLEPKKLAASLKPQRKLTRIPKAFGKAYTSDDEGIE